MTRENEEHKEKETSSEEQNPTGDNAKGDKSEAVKQTERLNKETEELELAIAKKKEVEARAKLGGVTGFPSQVPEKSPKEKAQEYARGVMQGKLPDET